MSAMPCMSGDRFYLLAAGEVGDGAGNLEDAAIGTGREF